MKMLNKPRRQNRPRAEDTAFIRHSVTKACGLRPDLDRLDDDELAELRALVTEIRASGTAESVERSDPASLNDVDKLRSWEALVCKASAKPSDYFDRERERAAAEAAAEKRARTPSQHPLLVEAGTIQIPASVFRGVQEGELPALHFLLITIVMSAIQNKAPLHRFMRVENGVVVVPSAEGLLATLDPDGNIRGVSAALRDLEDAGILVVVKAGEVRISLGDILKASLP